MRHSLIGGSTCKMTIKCPGSLALRRKMPPSPENEFTKKGTLCHLAVDAAVGTPNPSRVIGMTYQDLVLTEELYYDKVLPALHLFENEVDPDCILDFVTETEVSFGDYLPGVFGTADMIGRYDSTAVILDWKFGDGVKVEAEESYQGLFYAAAARRTEKTKWAFDGAKELEIVIIQPPNISIWRCPISRIDSFEAELYEAVKAAERQDAEFHHGDWCRWCTGKPICPKMTGAVDRALKTQFEGVDAKLISAYLKNADLLESWITDLRALALRMMEEGNVDIPDWNLVAKRATRKWANEAAAGAEIARIGVPAKDAYKTELLPPAQMEKVLKKLKKKLPADLVVSVSSGNTIAPKDDPRPEALKIGQQLSAALSKIV